MLSYLLALVVSVVILALADAFWIFAVSSRFNTNESSVPQNSRTSITQIISGLSVYVFITISIMVFVMPKTTEGEIVQTLFYGGLFGVLIYSIFEATNYFVLDKYSKFVAVLDIVFSGASIGFVSLMMRYIIDSLS